MEDPTRYLPYPELVEPRPGATPFRIRDSRGRPDLPSSGVVDKTRRALYVPLSWDGRSVSRHELAHVLWSPMRLPRVRFPIVVLHCVEDARINLGLEALGVPVRLDAEQRTQVRLLGLRELKAGKVAAFTLRWIASLGTNVADDLAEAAALHGSGSAEFGARVVRRVGAKLRLDRHSDPVAPFESAHAVAREVAKALTARGALDPAFREIELELGCSLSKPCDEEGRRARRGFEPGGDDHAEVLPGRMSLAEAPMTLAHPKARVGLERVGHAACEGTQLRGLHRWALDKAVFRRPARRRGGTVLVDVSGSMHLDSDDLEAILDASRGAALVAVYSGREDEGELRVVARSGRRAAPEHLARYGNGNIVDLPALRWLSRQPEPRVWVSDGGVTGVGDRSGRGLRERCEHTRRAGRIRRVPSAKAAADLLAARPS